MGDLEYTLTVEKNQKIYIGEVKKWSILMLTTLRGLPNTSEKLTLLQQVDQLKDMYDIEVGELPAFTGALAVLSNKAANLLKGLSVNTGYTKEHVANMLHSELLRAVIESDPNQIVIVKDLLALKSRSTGSETLFRLSRTGH